MRRPPPPPDSPPPTGLPIVLLAEDDDELRHLLARRLRRVGCEVIEARNGIELVDLVVEQPTTALVISDLRMPGRNGLEVLRLLRRASVAVPVILVTGFGADEVHAEATSLGAVVFDKPADLDALAAHALYLIGQHAPLGQPAPSR